MKLHEAPLVVLDRKRNQGRFVILDHGTYERLVRGKAGTTTGAVTIEDIDFAHHGIFWDRPTMTNARFAAILNDPEHRQYHWAWARVLERLPSRIITRAVPLAYLRRLTSLVRLRPRIRRAWEDAIEFWTEEARRRLA